MSTPTQCPLCGGALAHPHHIYEHIRTECIRGKGSVLDTVPIPTPREVLEALPERSRAEVNARLADLTEHLKYRGSSSSLSVSRNDETVVVVAHLLAMHGWQVQLTPEDDGRVRLDVVLPLSPRWSSRED